jgi:PAS domain S-box-containing protein
MTQKPTYAELEKRVKELEIGAVERKRIEKKLEEKEQTLQALLNAPPETAILVDLDGTVLAINEVGAQRFGKKIDELIGKGMHDRMPYDLAVSRKAQGDKVARSGRPVRYQDERAGRIYDNNIYPVFDAEEKVTALAIHARDITETKRAEEALRESEERYRSIIHKIQAAIVVHDADTRITACNSKSQELLGLTEDQMLGKTAMDSEWKFLNADGESMSLKEYPVNQVLATQQPLRDLIVGIYRPNKVEQVWVLINADPVFDYKENIQQVIVTFMDITELKKAEEEINQQRTFLNLTIESLPHPFYVINASDYTIKLANSATGLGDLSKEATTCYTLTHNKDRPCEAPEHICPLEKIKKTRKPVTVEHIHHDQEGKPKNVEVHAYPIFDSEGNVSQIILSLFDITQRKQAEEALQESEEKYRELVEGTDDLITRVDKDGKFIFVNYMSYKVFGLAPKDCVGKSAFDFIYPDDKERTRKWFDDVIAMHRTSGTSENRQVSQNGEIHYMLWTSNFLYDPYGNLIGVNGIARDITKKKQAEEALRESEERFRNVYDTAPLAFVVWDINTHVIDWNKKAKELFGWTKEEVIGNNFFDFLIPEKYRPHVEDVVDSLMKGELLSHSINDNLTKEGKIIICEWNNSALHDTDGNIIGAISLGLDITERKKTEEDRKKLINELQKALKEIKTLRGILPLCSFCKKIRDDKGYWEQVDVYIYKHLQADISHSICPECAKEHYPDLDINED